MVPDEGASVDGLVREKIPQWKSNKKVFECQREFGRSDAVTSENQRVFIRADICGCQRSTCIAGGNFLY